MKNETRAAYGGLPRVFSQNTQDNADKLAKIILFGLIILLVSLSTNFILGTDQSKEYLGSAFERRLDTENLVEGSIEWQVILAIAAMLLQMLIIVSTCTLFHARIVELSKYTGSRAWYIATLIILAIAAWPFYTFANSILSAYRDVFKNFEESHSLSLVTERQLSFTLYYFITAVAGCGAVSLAAMAAHQRWPKPMNWVSAFVAISIVLIAGVCHITAAYLQPDWFRLVGAFALVFIGGAFVWAVVFTFWAVRIPDTISMVGYGLIAILVAVKGWGLERTDFTVHKATPLIQVKDCSPQASAFLAFERKILSGLLDAKLQKDVLSAIECDKAEPASQDGPKDGIQERVAPGGDYFQQKRFSRSLTTNAERQGPTGVKTVAEDYEQHAKEFFGIPSVEEKILSWVKERTQEIEGWPSDKKYPIFIATAEGGGMYAAYLAAYALARLQDQCPQFSHHLFAISGVSGGGVGAQLFADLAYHKLALKDAPGAEFSTGDRCRETQSKGAYEKAIEQFFLTDFQAPLVGTLLFSDTPTLVLPRWLTTTDRATALAWAFDSGWDRMWKRLPEVGVRIENEVSLPTGKRQFFTDPAQVSDASPSVIINATLSNNGMPVILAPFYFSNFYGAPDNPNSWAFFRFAHFFDVLPGIEVPLTTGVLLGARFPYITPGGRFPIHLGSRRVLFQSNDIVLADGGYFDNTGTATALALVRRIRDVLPTELRSKIDLRLVRLVDPTSPGYTTVLKSPNEAILPLATLYSTRAFTRDFYAGLMQEFQASPFDVVFDSNGTPLSWQLSRSTRKRIERAVDAGLTTPGKGLYELRSLLSQ